MNALLNIPDAAEPGALVQVKVLIRHPMETGFRTDRDGSIVPRDIIRNVRCTYAGAEVFRADFFPAVAANPFLSFHLRASVTGDVTISWTDHDGRDHAQTHRLTVG